jgi:uncharacterized protein YggE
MENKNPVQGVLSVFLLVTTVLLVYSVFWGPLSDLGNQYPTRTVNVSASGKATVRPDVALVSFSVVNEGTSTQAITDENNQRVNRVISYLKEQGIAEEDIKTTGYSLQPVYTQPTMYSSGFAPSIARYSLTQTVQAKVRDFSKVSAIMGEVVSMGVNRLNNISFIVDDQEKYLAEARAEAFKKAAEKAEIMAEQSGIKLGKVVSVNEYGGPQPYPYYDKVSAVAGMGGAEQRIAAPDIQPGTSELEVQVNIVYEIK